MSYESQRPSIPEYFSGKTIAITGATGFIGHSLIEKLLRCCPDIKKICLFIRYKKNLTSQERLEKLTKLAIFDKLRGQQPDFKSKLQVVPCDLQKDDFGLDEEAHTLISSEVQIFFHSAATLRFNEHLRVSYQVNTAAIRTVLQLCRNMKHLEALVHISTAYSFCNQSEIGEEVYKTGWDVDKLRDSMTWMTDDMITKLTPDIIRDRPNTYTLTKAFGEEVIIREGLNLPICIVRPSIVGCSYEDPIPGWCVNLAGATGMFMAYGKGLLRSLLVDPQKSLDIIPSDFVVSGTIAAAWKTGTTRPGSLAAAHSPIGHPSILSRAAFSYNKEMSSLGRVDVEESDEVSERRSTIPIYHIVAGSTVPNTQWHSSMSQTFVDYPLDNAFQFPDLSMTTNKYMYRMLAFFREYIPAYVFDAGLMLIGQKPRLLRLNQQMSGAIDVLQFFLINEWKWSTKSVVQLQSQLSEEDKKVFNFDLRTIDWYKYMEQYTIGMKKYVMKENPKGYPAARRHLQRLRVLGYCFQCAAFMILWRLLVSRTSFAKNLWHLFMSLWFKFLGFFQISSTLHRSSFFFRIFSKTG